MAWAQDVRTLSHGDRNSHVLVAQIVVHGRREETKFRQPRKMGDAMYHTILYAVHLAPSCESIVGCNNSILVVIYGYISKSCSILPIITTNPFESSLL
jgi:hypothetical protein